MTQSKTLATPRQALAKALGSDKPEDLQHAGDGLLGYLYAQTPHAKKCSFVPAAVLPDAPGLLARFASEAGVQPVDAEVRPLIAQALESLK